MFAVRFPLNPLSKTFMGPNALSDTKREQQMKAIHAHCVL